MTAKWFSTPADLAGHLADTEPMGLPSARGVSLAVQRDGLVDLGNGTTVEYLHGAFRVGRGDEPLTPQEAAGEFETEAGE